jgi:hypothetical protein
VIAVQSREDVEEVAADSDALAVAVTTPAVGAALYASAAVAPDVEAEAAALAAVAER